MSVKKRYMLLYTQEYLFEHPTYLEAETIEEAQEMAGGLFDPQTEGGLLPYDIRTTDMEVIEVDEHGHIIDEYGLTVPHVELEPDDILRDTGGEG